MMGVSGLAMRDNKISLLRVVLKMLEISVGGRVGYKNCCFVHVALVPELGGEQKTKPTQHSVKQMRALGA